MMPKEKARELFKKYYLLELEADDNLGMMSDAAKRCALIAVDEMIGEIECMYELKELKKSNNRYLKYWQQVKEEINKI